MLLWASKLDTAEIECIFEMGQETPLGVPLILLVMEQNIKKKKTYFRNLNSKFLGTLQQFFPTTGKANAYS